jgi:hypothetical protein
MTQKMKSVFFSLCKREFNVSELLNNIRSVGPICWSWGMSEFGSIDGKGLVFRVNGHHHKGWISINLDWLDTFDVHLINTDGTIKKTFEMVYIDMLIDTIDNSVERVPDYQF